MSAVPMAKRRTEHAFPQPDVQVFARGHDIEREAIEVVFGYWASGQFTRHMTPTQARNLAESLVKAADHWDSQRPKQPEGESNG